MCTADEGGEEIDGSLVSLLQRDEVVRKVTQIFCLERLASGDTITARTLLANIVAVSPVKAYTDIYGAVQLLVGIAWQLLQNNQQPQDCDVIQEPLTATSLQTKSHQVEK